MQGKGLMRFLRAACWEFLQNLPLAIGFVVALQLWQQGQWGAAIACMVAGSVVGALVIHVTESKIVEGHCEPLRVTVANSVAMTVLMLATVAYLSASWSRWETDLLVGVLGGVILGIVQDLAAGEPIGVRHCIALGCAAPLALVGVRALVVTLPALANILIITAFVTLVIALIDYGPAFRASGNSAD
jgi:hypothetical protein